MTITIMALTVLFVSGPRRSGKSSVIQQVIADCTQRSPHYLRLTAAGGDKPQPVDVKPPKDDCGVASAQWVQYNDDRVFEQLPAALSRIYKSDRYGLAIIEGDSDPLLRHAYPYDHRVFVMPAPERASELFRTSTQATEAFKAALNDTAAFASEIYGLCDGTDEFDAESHESRSQLTAAQLRSLMTTPLGDELATRILLQPSHHGLLESDIVLVNTGVGGVSEIVDECVRRLQRVLVHVRGADGRKRILFCCDPSDASDPLRPKLLARIAAMLGCREEQADDLEDTVF